MHNPTLIPALLRDTSVNKGLIYRELRKALPCRIGIEFEMGANFRVGFQKKYNPKATDKDIAKHYGVLEVRCDDAKISFDQAVRRRNEYRRQLEAAHNDPNMDEPCCSDDYHDDCDKLIESRVSIKDYSQLAGLYKFMQDLPEFCTLHEGGGIHIHIDMSMFPYEHKAKETEIHRWLTHRLDEIGNLFPKYKGKYNAKKVGIRSKSTWLNMSGKHTLEFRTPPLTFDYYTLMTWIVGVVKFRNKLIHECQLKKDWGCQKVIEQVLTEINRLSGQLCTPQQNGQILETYTQSLNGSDYVLISNNDGSEWQVRRQGTSNTDYWSA
jgi:hypothetical protein